MLTNSSQGIIPFLESGLGVDLLSHSFDDFFRLALESAQQNLACRDVLDEAHSNPRRPNPILRVSNVIDNLSPRTRHKIA